MRVTNQHQGLHLAGLALLASSIALAISMTSVRPAHGGVEIVPAVGLTKSVDGDNQSKAYGSLALRGDLTPFLMAEVQGAYRTENRFDDQLKLRMWPITASMYFKPVNALYLGAGVGWYQISYDYAETVPATVAENHTTQEFGVHLGGGLRVPLAPNAAIDLSGRYVMMRDQESHLVPEKFNPDFWTTSLGLALKF
jgi:opacity protein-like surface antigen